MARRQAANRHRDRNRLPRTGSPRVNVRDCWRRPAVPFTFVDDGAPLDLFPDFATQTREAVGFASFVITGAKFLPVRDG